MGGHIEPLAEDQAQGGFAALLQGSAGKLVEVEEGQPAIGIAEEFRPDPGAGQQRLARHPQFLGEAQQRLRVGDRHQFGGEGQRLLHIGVLFWLWPDMT
ncbi:hypothetical protein D3C78_1654080 [compost metagenome]